MEVTPTQDAPAIGEDVSGKIELAESRIRDGWHAHSIFRKLEWDDTNAEAGRANIDYQIDGGLPYDPQVMRDANRGDEANVNFREARAEDDLAQTPFIEMTTVTPILWNIRTSHGNETERVEWGRIISEEFTKTVRDWGEDFDYFRQRLAQQFTRHGAGFAYFEDEFTWKWRSDGLGSFKLPRNTESRTSAIPYCICKRSMSVSELYKFVHNEKKAQDEGHWNVNAVKRSLVYATSKSGQDWFNYGWEGFQRQAKENDIEFSTRSEKVRVYHLWCIEFDGQISHYIGLQDGVAMEQGEICNPEDVSENSEESEKSNMVGNGFLYAYRCRFPSFESAIISFFYAIGTHATIHTIRGQGEMNFAPISLSNKITCKMSDLAAVSSMLLLGVDNANEAQNIAFVQRGAFMVYSRENGAKAEPTEMPDVSSRLNPLLDRLAGLRRQISPSNSQPEKSNSKQPKNKYEIQSEQNRTGSLNSAMLTQFFGPWGRLGKEMYRRMMNPKLHDDDPGGREAFAFRAACMALGVPKEAMQFDKVTVDAVRTIGNGSPEQRQYASEQILEMSEGFDEHGKWQARMDAVASVPGVNYAAAMDYVGPEKPRQPIDKQVANVENALFTLGQKQPVETEENHWVHCLTHSELVKQTVEALQNGEMEGAKLVPILSAALENMLAHSKLLSEDSSKGKESAWVRHFVQTNNGVLEQQENKLVAAIQRQQEAAQQPSGQEQPQPPDQGAQQEMAHKQGEEQRRQDIHQAKLAQMQQEYEMRQRRFNQELISQDADARQKRSLADLKAAHETAIEAARLASQGA
jgi:hypothetical protein